MAELDAGELVVGVVAARRVHRHRLVGGEVGEPDELVRRRVGRAEGHLDHLEAEQQAARPGGTGAVVQGDQPGHGAGGVGRRGRDVRPDHLDEVAQVTAEAPDQAG